MYKSKLNLEPVYANYTDIINKPLSKDFKEIVGN